MLFSQRRRLRRRLQLLAILSSLLFLVCVGFAVSAETNNANEIALEQLSEDQLIEAELAGEKAAWDTEEEPESSKVSAERLAAAAPTDCLGSPTAFINYAQSSETIYLEGCGAVYTLSDIAADPMISTDELELVDAVNKVWLLKVKMRVQEGATLNVIGDASGGDANWLQLRSEPNDSIWLKSRSGAIYFEDTKLTSWDPGENDYDMDLTDGRSYVSARTYLDWGRATAPATPCDVNGGTREPYEARMDIIRSEMAYLGYQAGESYGTNWKVYSPNDGSEYVDSSDPNFRMLFERADVFGSVIDSHIHHNRFGTFTWGGYCMEFLNNIYEDNESYGLDPHDDSDFLVIDNNIFRNNGNHGFICSKYCSNLIITNNEAYGNVNNGMMLHRLVNNAVFTGNYSHDNSDSGLAIFDSHDNLLEDNRFENNGKAGIRFSVSSSGNVLISNTITTIAESVTGDGYGLYFYDGSDIPTNGGDGRTKNNVVQDMHITSYKEVVVRVREGENNTFEDVTIRALSTSPDIVYRFAPGYGNRVIRPIFTPDSIIATHYRSDGGTENTIIDQELDTPFEYRAENADDVHLFDSRNYVWFTTNDGLTTTANPISTTLEFNGVDVDEYETITTLDFIVEPTSGDVEITPTQWQTTTPYTRTWTAESSNSSGPVLHELGGFAPDACFEVTVDGVLLTSGFTSATGRVSFNYADGYSSTKLFEVTVDPTCVPTAVTVSTQSIASNAIPLTMVAMGLLAVVLLLPTLHMVKTATRLSNE